MAGRKPFLVSAAVFLVIFAACIFAACTTQQSTESKIPTSLTVNTHTMPIPPRGPVVPTLSEGTDVKIHENDFEPYTLVVMNGTIVTWTNEDDLNNDYSVVSDNGTPVSFQSGTISKGGIFKFKFIQPGTYPYHSTITSDITGKIIVL